MKPGAICAYVRHPEVVKTSAQPGFERFFRSSWRQQLWGRLFQPILGRNQRVPDSLSTRHEMLYSYHEQQLHPDRSHEEETHRRWESMRKDKRQARARVRTASERAVIDWFKAHLEAGAAFSVAAGLFDAAREGPLAMQPLNRCCVFVLRFMICSCRKS